jgi:hypothetical protein
MWIAFWDIIPCMPQKVNRRFRGIYRPHFQGQRISQARNQQEETCEQSSTLKMDETCSFITTIEFQRATWCYAGHGSQAVACFLFARSEAVTVGSNPT